MGCSQHSHRKISMKVFSLWAQKGVYDRATWCGPSLCPAQVCLFFASRQPDFPPLDGLYLPIRAVVNKALVQGVYLVSMTSQFQGRHSPLGNYAFAQEFKIETKKKSQKRRIGTKFPFAWFMVWCLLQFYCCVNLLYLLKIILLIVLL